MSSFVMAVIAAAPDRAIIQNIDTHTISNSTREIKAFLRNNSMKITGNTKTVISAPVKMR